MIGALLHKFISQEGIAFGAGDKLLDKLSGRATFALTALVQDGKETHLIALNDEKAFEPFCFATIDGTFVASSESCSHRRLGGDIEREYDGAEMTICSSKGPETKRLRNEPMMPDIFQGAYFGNVASVFRGKEIFPNQAGNWGWPLWNIIKHLGRISSIPNPESGWGVTVGIAEGLKTNLYPALIKLPQAVRTFPGGRTNYKDSGGRIEIWWH